MKVAAIFMWVMAAEFLILGSSLADEFFKWALWALYHVHAWHFGTMFAVLASVFTAMAALKKEKA